MRHQAIQQRCPTTVWIIGREAFKTDQEVLMVERRCGQQLPVHPQPPMASAKAFPSKTVLASVGPHPSRPASLWENSQRKTARAAESQEYFEVLAFCKLQQISSVE